LADDFSTSPSLCVLFTIATPCDCRCVSQAAKVINGEMVPAILPLIESKLSHPREIIRKKAILVLHRFFREAPASVLHLSDAVRRALCDQDPGVMAGANICPSIAVVQPSLIATSCLARPFLIFVLSQRGRKPAVHLAYPPLASHSFA